MKRLFSGIILLLLIAAGGIFFTQKDLAEERQSFIWTMAKAEMPYGRNVLARIEVPRLNRSVLVTGKKAPAAQTGRYAVWQNDQPVNKVINNIALVSGAKDQVFSFLRYVEKNDVIVLHTKAGYEARYQVNGFVMSESPQVKIPAAGPETGQEKGTLLLTTRYEYDGLPDAPYVYLVVIAGKINDAV